jgi:phage terminase small subunit
MKNGIPRAPSYLELKTRQWWRSVVSDWELEFHEKMLLTLAAGCWDRAAKARKVVDELGMTFTDRFGMPKTRPEVSIERLEKIAFLKIMKQLDLEGVEEPSKLPRRELAPPAIVRRYRNDQEK